METYNITKAAYVQIVNKEEWHKDEELRKLYPNLAEQICKHDEASDSSWYNITGEAVEEWEKYSK